MKRTKLIKDAFNSVVPEGTAGRWSQGYSGHTNNSDFFTYPDFEVTAVRNITDQVVPGTTDVVTNDVYIDYSYLTVTLSGSTTISGTTSIYAY